MSSGDIRANLEFRVQEMKQNVAMWRGAAIKQSGTNSLHHLFTRRGCCQVRTAPVCARKI